MAHTERPLTYGDCHRLELQLAQTVTCPHGTLKSECQSSMCYIHPPEDSEIDPDEAISQNGHEAFLLHLRNYYLKEGT